MYEKACSLTFSIISEYAAKAIASQQKSLEVLANMVLGNSIALDYLVTEESLCHSKVSYFNFINTSGIVANIRNQ